MSLRELHGFLSTAVSLFTLGISLMALYRYLRKEGLESDFWGAVVIGEVLIIVQAIVGGIMFGGGVRAYDWMHYVYGALAVFIWPAAYTYTHNQEDGRRQAGIWLGVSLFMFLMLTTRARVTGEFPTV